MNMPSFAGRLAISAVAFVSLTSCAMTPAPAASYWPTDGWRTATPESEGFDSARLSIELAALQKQESRIDSLLIVREGRLILEAYFDPYTGAFRHKLASVTKSVTASAVLMAVDHGKLQLDQPMISFFADRKIANLDERKKAVTVRHLMEMRNGMESGCMAQDEDNLDAMRSHSDWVQAALDRKMAQEPGTRFCYDSPGMHLLSAIVEKATGLTMAEYARKNLFEPLGIRDAAWLPDPRGHTRGWGDLFLLPREAAKIGYLWLQKGRWEGRQLISARALADMFVAHSSGADDDDDYGYGIWVSQGKPPDDGYFALGAGGQYIRVYPSHQLIVVVTAQGLRDYDDLEPLLSSFVSRTAPLPANPAGVAGLNATVARLVEPARPWPVLPVPAAARSISTKAFVFEPNAIELAKLTLESTNPAIAQLHMNLEGSDVVWPVGLDGRFQLAPTGQALRGYWSDPDTFYFQIFEDQTSTFRLHFTGESLEVSCPERGLQFTGLREKP